MSDAPIRAFEPQIQTALDYVGTHSVEDVWAEVAANRAQVWVEDGGLIVTQIEDWPTGPTLRFWVAAGELEPVMRLAERLYEWGREQGCERAVFLGRRGWAKPLADHGWEANRNLVYYERGL